MLALPRLMALSGLFTLILAGCLFGYASALSGVTGLDLASAALGTSPGGFAEMAVTAQVLHLSVWLVTAFHVVRAFMVNGFAEHGRAVLERVGLFAALNRLADRWTT